jgi:hypothetical protein
LNGHVGGAICIRAQVMATVVPWLRHLSPSFLARPHGQD